MVRPGQPGRSGRHATYSFRRRIAQQGSPHALIERLNEFHDLSKISSLRIVYLIRWQGRPSNEFDHKGILYIARELARCTCISTQHDLQHRDLVLRILIHGQLTLRRLPAAVPQRTVGEQFGRARCSSGASLFHTTRCRR